MRQLQDRINESLDRIISEFKIRMEAYAITQAPNYYRHAMLSALDVYKQQPKKGHQQ